jgi:hypothetical protein
LTHDVEDPTEVEALAVEPPDALLVARLEPHAAVDAGGAVMLDVGRGALFLFDPSSGLALV